jgi:uncharacterized protein (DUF736 family)
MLIGRFQKDENGFLGSIETLTMQLNPVRFVSRNKEADFAIHGPDDMELGAAWRKVGDYGDYLSVKLDCPSLATPINATMSMRTTESGFYLLRWNRRNENGRGNGQPETGE